MRAPDYEILSNFIANLESLIISKTRLEVSYILIK